MQENIEFFEDDHWKKLKIDDPKAAFNLYDLVFVKKFNESAAIEHVTALHRCKTTIRFVVKNFSTLTTTVRRSPPSFLRGLAWRIYIRSKGAESDKMLEIYVGCAIADAEIPLAPDWCCAASVVLRIVREGFSNFEKKFEHTYCAKESDRTWGFGNFLKWSAVCNPKLRYIKDDVVIIEAEIDAEQATGIPLESKSHALRMKQTKRLLKEQKFTDFKLTVKSVDNISLRFCVPFNF